MKLRFVTHGSVYLHLCLPLLLASVDIASPLWAADLPLWSSGRTEYQIILPDASPQEPPAFTAALQQTARLLQTAFEANGVKVPVVTESQHDASKPGVYVGQTKFATQHCQSSSKLEGWSYLQQAVGKDLVIAGNDEVSRIPAEAQNRRQPGWHGLGTAKGVADFARDHLGVRFLYPDLPAFALLGEGAKLDLLNSPAIEFLPRPVVTIPDNLKVQHAPSLSINTSTRTASGFYDIALNRFPPVNAAYGGHTWSRAVPPAEHAKAHPEYFALVNGQRQSNAEGNAQYCLSNPQVQELIYQDLADMADRGYSTVDLGQPDGFQKCQCQDCAKLYDTGDDWSEKIWIFNRKIAERLLKSHPKVRLCIMSYIQTAAPPKSFKAFPSNVNIMLTGTNEEDMALWKHHQVPGGFSGYVYNWCPNLLTNYTPMRTPGFVETQVKRLVDNQTRNLLRDGPGQLYGLEGPVYYTMGRMFDSPQQNAARLLVPEFCEAAFGNASSPMLAFYDQLYHAINLYSDHIGTRGDAWSYHTMDGRRRKTILDPFPLICLLYPPQLLLELDNDLTRAEAVANSPKAKTRLALVRTEFEYLRHFSRVAHLHQAFVLQPDGPSRDRLLDAIEGRNAFLSSLFGDRGRQKSPEPWAQPMFPFPGHALAHLQLAHDGYQEPFASTCFNWDTKAMRNAPLPGKKRLQVGQSPSLVSLDSPLWQKAPEADFTQVPPFNKMLRKSSVRALYDREQLHLLLTSELEPDTKPATPGTRKEQPLGDKESVDIYLAPNPAQELAYRFMAGRHPTHRYDAVNGAITDVMDPRHGKDDAAFNGAWEFESSFDPVTRHWRNMVSIPFRTLGVVSPQPGTVWKANFARNHPIFRDKVDRYIWSSTLGNDRMEDRSIFGDLEFQ